MGCKQTTTKPPPVVIATSPSTPNYVKSALKKPHVKGGGKTEKLSFLKKKDSTVNKSVNFDEKVRVKLRTPTPREKRYERGPSSKIVRGPVQNDHYGNHNDDDNDDGDDNDDEVTSVSSQEENLINEQIKKSKVVTPISSQRYQGNGFWQKTNAIGVIPNTNTIKEKPPTLPAVIQQPPINLTTDAKNNSNMPIGNIFRVRRKLPQPSQSQVSSPVVSPQSPSIPSSRSTILTPNQIVQRPLSDTNTTLIEHHASYSKDEFIPQTTYFTYNRRSTNKSNSSET